MNIRIRPELEKSIEEGLVAARSGELLDSESVRQLMDERKRLWLAERHSPRL